MNLKNEGTLLDGGFRFFFQIFLFRWVLLLEGLVFIIVVVLLAVIAILDRQG